MVCHDNIEHHHSHIPGCGHVTIEHGDHRDYLHDGALHHVHDEQVDEHTLPIGAGNPVVCTPDHHCDGHGEDHRHGPDCGHPTIPHGSHFDYIVGGHLHHPHGAHCDVHGEISILES